MNRKQLIDKTAEVKQQLINEGWTERAAHAATVRPWQSKSNHPAIKELAAMSNAMTTKVKVAAPSFYHTADLPDFDRDTSTNGIE